MNPFLVDSKDVQNNDAEKLPQAAISLSCYKAI